jgi:hypothetical protein
MFEMLTGIRIDLNKFLSLVNNGKERIKELDDDKWYLTGFIYFQYGGILNENSRTHKSVINMLNHYNIIPYRVEVKLTSNRPLIEVKQGVKDKDKDKDIIDSKKGGVGGKEKGFIPPTVKEVILYFKEKGFTEFHARKAFEFYDSAGWVDSRGNKVLNWKQKMVANWMKEGDKDQNIKRLNFSLNEANGK